MSNPQGSTVVNTEYFTAMAARANAASTCAALQSINTDVNLSVNATISAVNSQISTVQTQATELQSEITKLTGHIATLTASQTSVTAVGVTALTAAAVTDLATAIAYIKAQGLTLVSFGTTNTATFVEQALSLGAELIKIQHDYDILSNKINTLTAQISEIPSQLAALQSTMNAAALNFPSCSL